MSTKNTKLTTLFTQDTVKAAKALLGSQFWWRPIDEPKHPGLLFRIVETEAYTEEDPACHAYQTTKGRAANLYQRPGLAYIYLIYGMYHCLNIVTEPEGRAGAVLIRALEPVDKALEWKTHGPGRLCKALNITVATHNGLDLLDPSSPLQLKLKQPLMQKGIVTTTRIGISRAKDYPWRFYELANPYVSVIAK